MTRTALLLVDIQNDYFPSFEGSRMALPDMDMAADKASELLNTARSSGMDVIHVKHVMASDEAPFFKPGSKGAELHDRVQPHSGETVVEKTRPNSFIGTELETILRNLEVENLLVCGAMSQMCIDATVRAAADLGFNVTVAKDACAAANITHDDISVPADMVHASIMAPLAASYAKVQSASDCMVGLGN